MYAGLSLPSCSPQLQLQETQAQVQAQAESQPHLQPMDVVGTTVGGYTLHQLGQRSFSRDGSMTLLVDDPVAFAYLWSMP